ncbi:hypothetical protein [Pseudomonas sp. NPDC089401]|uniref:DUF7716 domain-containing protein n=1 Tax=Pseudomonas sp. NPDC089401 TaxID=3364462 RepID=UPI003818CF0F
MKIETLETILNSIKNQPWDFAIYMPHGVPWNEHTKCAVLDPDDFENEEDPERPKFATENNLHYALGIELTKSIIEYALAQKPQATAHQLASAFTYYYDNDAYLDWAKTE